LFAFLYPHQFLVRVYLSRSFAKKFCRLSAFSNHSPDKLIVRLLTTAEFPQISDLALAREW
jgi:hypothetical protein